MRRSHVLGALSACVIAAAGIAGAGPASASPDLPDLPSGEVNLGGLLVVSSGKFGEYSPGKLASTYDPKLVPNGSRATVLGSGLPTGGTTISLSVGGLVPDREYGVHLHSKPCGPTGDDAGPHFQDVPDPVQPSKDPKYANPENEVWMDFTTNQHGNAFTLANVDWQVGDRAKTSVVIHETHTHTHPGEAGQAGERLACINADF